MSTIGPGMNPLSNQFTKSAIRVASTNVASVKSDKEAKPKDSKEGIEESHQDSVMLSSAQQQEPSDKAKATGAEQSGVMSELRKRERKDEDDKELSMFGSEQQKYQYIKNSQKGKEHQKDKTKIKAAGSSKLRKILERSPDEILRGVPTHFAEISKAKVKADLATKPKSLTRIEPPPETAPIELEPIPYLEIAPICDKAEPIQMEIGLTSKV